MAVPTAGEVYYAEDGTVSMVLEDNYDSTYEPSQKEMDEYGKWLGIDPEQDKELMWIAREGLKAPLPKAWKPCKTDTGEVYYFNFESGDSIWDHPMDEHYKKKVADERAKLKSGGGGGGGGSKKSKEKKLEKGAAGSDPLTKSASGRSADPAPVRTGRLGAIGSSMAGGAAQRPDVSDLVPPKQQQSQQHHHQASSSLLPANNIFQPKKDILQVQSEERKVRDKWNAEYKTARDALTASHEKQVDSLRSELEEEMHKAERDLKTHLNDTVDQAKRLATRSIARETQSYEQNLTRQKDELRRSIRMMEHDISNQSASLRSKTETEVNTEKEQISAQVQEQSRQERSQIETAWQEERTAAEVATETAIRDMRMEYDRQRDAVTQQLQNDWRNQLTRQQEEHRRDVGALKQKLHDEVEEHGNQLRQKGGNNDNSSVSTEYEAVEKRYREAVHKAQQDMAQALSGKRAQLVEEQDVLRREHEEQMQRINAMSVASGADSSEGQNMDAEKARFDTLLNQHLEKLKTEHTGKTSKYAEATESLVTANSVEPGRSKASGGDIKIAAHERNLKDEKERVEKEQAARLEDGSAETRRKVRQNLQKKKDEWLSANANASPTTTSSSSAAGVVPAVTVPDAAQLAADERQLRDKENQNIMELKLSLETDLQTEVEEHRSKAKAEVLRRLAQYQPNLQSPTGAKMSEERKSEMRSKTVSEAVEAERALLQAKLSQTAVELAATRQQLPPRPASTSLATPTAAAATDFTQQQQQQLQPQLLNDDQAAAAALLGMQQQQQQQQQQQDLFDAQVQLKQQRKEERLYLEIQRLSDTLRLRKHDLNSRQRAIEAAREDWRADWSAAKERGDETEQGMLRKVKKILEGRALELNDEAVEIKRGVAATLKEKQARLAEMQNEHRRRNRSSSATGRQRGQYHVHSDPAAAAAASSNIDDAAMLDVLHSLADKVNSVETRVIHLTHQTPTPRAATAATPTTSTPRHHHHHHQKKKKDKEEESDAAVAPGPTAGAAAAAAKMDEKWVKWLNENSPNAKKSKSEGVQEWLQETNK